MLLALKFLMLSILFVGTGGGVFTKWGQEHKSLVLLAGIVAIIGSTYLIRDIYNDLKGELKKELQTPFAADRTPPAYEGVEPPKRRMVEVPQKPTAKSPTCVTFNGQRICE